MTAGPEAVHIFRKDLALLWGRALAWAALMTVLAIQDAAIPEGNAQWYTGLLVDAPFVAACFYLAAALIQADGPAGECPYWVTRPFSRGGLAAGKVLGLVLLLNEPVLAAQWWSLAANGLAPLDHLSLLWWRQVFFTARVALPAAAMASVTRGRRGFAAGALLYLAVCELPRAASAGASSWSGFEWLRAVMVAAIAGSAAVVALWLQYSARRTAAARRWLLGGAAAICLWQWMPWHVGFAMQRMLLPSVAPGMARMAYAPARRAPPAGMAGSAELGMSRVAIPVEAAGLPVEHGVRIEGIRATIGGGGRDWDSGWRLTADLFVAADGAHWLPIDVPVEFCRADAPAVHLRTTLALTVLGDATSTELELGGARLAIGTGVCWTHPAGGVVSVVCSSPAWGAAESRVRVQSQSTGQMVTRNLTEVWAGALNYGSFPTGAGLSLWRRRLAASVTTPPFPIGIIVDTQAPVGETERTMEAPGVRLAMYRLAGAN